jgi:hypothetical protein
LEPEPSLNLGLKKAPFLEIMNCVFCAHDIPHSQCKDQPKIEWPSDIPKGCTVDIDAITEYNEKYRQLKDAGASEEEFQNLRREYKQLWED